MPITFLDGPGRKWAMKQIWPARPIGVVLNYGLELGRTVTRGRVLQLRFSKALEEKKTKRKIIRVGKVKLKRLKN